MTHAFVVRIVRRLPRVAGALFALGCGAPASPGAPVFGGQGAVVDPGPRAGAVEAQSAPTDPCAAPAAVSTDSRVENFEDADNRLFGSFEREGYWYSATDHTPGSSVFPAEGKFEASKLTPADATLDNLFAAHFTADGEKDWGVSWGTTLRHVGAQAKCALNVSGFAGLRLRARGSGTVSVRFGMPETVAAEYGGRCVEHCWDVHAFPLHLGPEWQVREIRWDQLAQAGWGKSVRFDPAHLLGIEFMVAPANLPADFWVDDLEWIRPAPAP